MKENKSIVTVNHPVIENDLKLIVAEIAARLDATVSVREMTVKPTTKISAGPWGVTVTRTGKTTYRECVIDPRQGGRQQ